MTYRHEQKKMGITISISSDRKYGNGAKGSGRKGSTGKKAVVLQEGCDKVVVRGCTATELLRTVREQFKIPHYITINREGETCI